MWKAVSIFSFIYKVGSHSVIVTSFIGDGVMRRDGSAGLSDTDILRASRINHGFSGPPVFPGTWHQSFTFSADIRGRKTEHSLNLCTELKLETGLKLCVSPIGYKDELTDAFTKYRLGWEVFLHGFMLLLVSSNTKSPYQQKPQVQ